MKALARSPRPLGVERNAVALRHELHRVDVADPAGLVPHPPVPRPVPNKVRAGLAGLGVDRDVVWDPLDKPQEAGIHEYVARGLAVEQDPVRVDPAAAASKRGALDAEERVGSRGGAAVSHRQAGAGMPRSVLEKRRHDGSQSAR